MGRGGIILCWLAGECTSIGLTFSTWWCCALYKGGGERRRQQVTQELLRVASPQGSPIRGRSQAPVRRVHPAPYDTAAVPRRTGSRRAVGQERVAAGHGRPGRPVTDVGFSPLTPPGWATTPMSGVGSSPLSVRSGCVGIGRGWCMR